MNDELYHEIYEEAAKLFRAHNSKVKGQMVSSADSFEYWIMYVAYQKGERSGYSDGYEDASDHNLCSGVR
jgi:hypothetical protein